MKKSILTFSCLMLVGISSVLTAAEFAFYETAPTGVINRDRRTDASSFLILKIDEELTKTTIHNSSDENKVNELETNKQEKLLDYDEKFELSPEPIKIPELKLESKDNVIK